MRIYVIDTNVLEHANNAEVSYCEASKRVINEFLKDDNFLVALDEGLSMDESRNKSMLLCEYLKRLVPGDLGSQLLQELASSGRLRAYSRKVDRRTTKILNQHVKNKVDRVFVRVTVNTPDRQFITHDFEDFSGQKRQLLSRELHIDFLTADDIQVS